MALFTIDSVDNFEPIRAIKPKHVCSKVVEAVKRLDEKDEIETWIQAILCDTNNTPHGPSEIVDILTHKASVKQREGLAAFILKGKSFPTVRPSHVAHQIFRLERLQGISFAIFAAPGVVLDDVKEQFISTARRLQVGYSFWDANDLGRLFIAFGYLCPHEGNKIKGGRCSCGYNPKTRVSNILQQASLAELRIAHDLGQRAGALILPTASGKTRVAVLDVKRQGATRCIYVAHSHEILESAEEEFLSIFPRSEVTRFSERPTKVSVNRINLITIQTLARNLSAFSGEAVDYLIIDEYHHAAAPSYRKVIDGLAPVFLLGLTATPFRIDQQNVLELCDNNVIVSYELREGIECGVLSPYHYYGCFDDIDYSDIQHNGARYDIADLERALVIPERDAAIIDKWKEKAEGRPTIAFCCTHAHAKRVAKSFNEAGVGASVYLSDTSTEKRDLVRKSFRARETMILCVVDILNEGVDLPFVECLLFLRPTESKRVFLQQFGRGLRRFYGKDYCVVIDFIGNFKNAFKVIEHLGLEPFEEAEQGLVTAPRRSPKDVVNLPRGCVVEFDERVINIFGTQTNDPRYATRQNIARILVYQYRKLEERLRRRPTRLEINRSCRLDSSFYATVFGSWRAFEEQLDQSSSPLARKGEIRGTDKKALG